MKADISCCHGVGGLCDTNRVPNFLSGGIQ